MTISPDLTPQIVHEDLFATQPPDEKKTIALKNVLEILPKDDEEIPQPLRKLANQLITAKNTASYVKVLSPAKLLLNVLYLDSNLNK